MKKNVILALLLLISLSGLVGCGILKPTQTVVDAMEDWICNPPADVMAVVNQSAEAVALGLNTFVPDTPEWVLASLAQTGIISLQTSGCALMNQVSAIISFLDNPKTKALLANTKGMKPVLPNSLPLQLWLVDKTFEGLKKQAGK